MEGIVKTKNDKGYGFIAIEGEEKELFFHKNDLQGITFDELKEGDKVSFEKVQQPGSLKGPNATNVTRI